MLMLILILKLTFPQRVAVERMEKLGEQLEEARKLRQSIFRRGDAVFAIVARSVQPICPCSISIFCDQVPGPTQGGAVRRVHQGEDPVDRGDEAAVRAGQGRGGVDQVPQGVHRQQRHDHLILITAISSDCRSHCWKVTALLVNGLDSKFWQKLPRLWESPAISTDCGWTLMGESNAQRIKWWKMWIYNTNQTFFCFAYMCHLWTAVTGRSLVLFWS